MSKHSSRSFSDEKVVIIFARMADEFTEKVNELLETGDWRITETYMSACDHDYQAMLIKSRTEGKQD